MKNKFQFTTLRNLAFTWLTGTRKLSFAIKGSNAVFEEDFEAPLRQWYTFTTFLHTAKQDLIMQKLGEDKLMSMTMAEIFSYPV